MSTSETKTTPTVVPIPDTLRCLTIEEYTKDTNKPSSSKVTSYTCQVVDKTVASLVSKPEQVLLSVEYAALTYADALVVLGRSGAAREYPIIPGADFVGVVLKDNSEQFDVGDRVIAHGGELGRAIDGGFATLCYAPLSTLTRLPTNLTNKRAAMMGSAGVCVCPESWSPAGLPKGIYEELKCNCDDLIDWPPQYRE